MSSYRTSVEGYYKDIKQKLKSNDFKRLIKVKQGSIAVLYKTFYNVFEFKSLFILRGTSGDAFQMQASLI